MNANAWAALGMSVTDASKQASKQADLRIEKTPPLPRPKECVSLTQNLMFLSDMHSFVSVLCQVSISRT